MPNIFAFLMLALWPFFTLVIFRRIPVEKAILWSIVAGYLFLPPPPAGFDLPLLPAFNKHTIPSLSVFIFTVSLYGDRGPLLPQSPVVRVLLAIFVFSPVFTVLTNGDPVFFGQVGIQGLAIKDMVALCGLQFLYCLPFLVARRFLNTTESQKQMLKVLLILGLAYSILMLIEVRLSPQLNIWIYGYFQHVFSQMVRFGGFRPLVFLYHGLWVALFAMMVVVSALALARAELGRERAKIFLAALYMMAVLVLCKSMGSLIFAAFLIPMVLFVGQGTQIRVAALIAAVTLAYPMLKGVGLIPVEWMLDQAAAVSTERAASLKFRFDNEEILMERAALKPLFGWGSWGRNHILDSVTGTILTVTDGRWIIVIGVYGWLGFLAEFGLLTLPIFMIWQVQARGALSDHSPYLGAISLLLAINVLDMIPNATLTPLTWLFSGALLGYAERAKIRIQDRQHQFKSKHIQTVM